MTAAREGRSWRASEATPDRGLGCAPYINFCQSKIDTNLLFSVSDRILREIWESRNFVILVPDLALADRAHIKNSKWQLQHTKHDNANLIFYSYSKRMWVLPVQVRIIKIWIAERVNARTINSRILIGSFFFFFFFIALLTLLTMWYLHYLHYTLHDWFFLMIDWITDLWMIKSVISFRKELKIFFFAIILTPRQSYDFT